MAFQAALQLDGIVARVEDEQRNAPRGSASRRRSKSLTCATATSLASSSGRTRLASMGATHESRSKESPATNW